MPILRIVARIIEKPLDGQNGNPIKLFGVGWMNWITT